MKHFSILILLVLLTACSRQTLKFEPFPDALSDAAPITREVFARQLAFENLSAKLSLHISGTQESIPELDADLIMQPPNRIRLRAYSALGQTAFDLLYTEKNIELYLPQRKEIVIIPVENLASIEFGGKPFALPSAQEWLHVFKPLTDLEKFLANDPTYGPDEKPHLAIITTSNQTLTFEKISGLVVQMKNANRDFSYSDFCNFGSKGIYARKIEIVESAPSSSKSPTTSPALTIQIKSLDLNVKIPSAAFDTQSREDLRVTTLAK